MQENLDLAELLAETKAKPIVTLPEIIDYIPQKPPVVMVDRIFRGNDKSVLTGLFIKEDNIFSERGVFSESGLIENIAQSAAAGVGIDYVNAGLPIPLGFIGAVKSLNIHFLPEVNTHIYTLIEEVNEVFGITIIHGIVFSDRGVVASCEMKVLVEKTK